MRDKGIEPLAPTWKEGVLAITPNPHYEMVHLVNYDITTYRLSTDCSASELQVVMKIVSSIYEDSDYQSIVSCIAKESSLSFELSYYAA